MIFSKRSDVNDAVKPPSFIQVFIEANQYIFNDFKRLFSALYPVLILLLVCTVGLVFSENGFSSLGWMSLLWGVIYVYLNMLVIRDVIGGRQSDSAVLNRQHPADIKCFFFSLAIALFYIFPWSLAMLAAMLTSYFTAPFFGAGEFLFAILIPWVAILLALLLCALAVRWSLIIPAAYDGVKLRLSKIKGFSRRMWSHIFMWAVVIVLDYTFFSFEMIRDLASSMEVDGEVISIIEGPSRVTLGLFMETAIHFFYTLYFLFVSSYAFCRIYQWCSQNAE